MDVGAEYVELDGRRLPVLPAPLVGRGHRNTLFGAHRYWGKKNPELVRHLVETLSSPGDLVVDPFLGSGWIAREATLAGRQFAGADLNPVAVEISRLVTELADPELFNREAARVLDVLEPTALRAYRLEDEKTGSHFRWDGDALVETQVAAPRGLENERRAPTAHDLVVFKETAGYAPRRLKPLSLPQHSRTGSSPDLTWQSFFTGRALLLLEAALDEIDRVADERVRRALRLCLTAVSGHVSKMCTVKARRTSGYEVGGWITGLYRPAHHFEVNVVDALRAKTQALGSALRAYEPVAPRIEHMDAFEFLAGFNDGSIDALITDPPHSDRQPYGELSSLMTGLLGANLDFEHEMVASRAHGVGRTRDWYWSRLNEFLELAETKIRPGGSLALAYASSRRGEWAKLIDAVEGAGFKVDGVVPAAYSIRSVIQSTKSGPSHDLVLVARR